MENNHKTNSKKKYYKSVKLQQGANGQYRISIPAYMVKTNLVAEGGDKIKLENRGNSIIITKE